MALDRVPRSKHVPLRSIQLAVTTSLLNQDVAWSNVQGVENLNYSAVDCCLVQCSLGKATAGVGSQKDRPYSTVVKAKGVILQPWSALGAGGIVRLIWFFNYQSHQTPHEAIRHSFFT